MDADLNRLRGPVVGVRKVVERMPATYENGVRFPGEVVASIEVPLYACDALKSDDPAVRALADGWEPPDEFAGQDEEAADSFALRLDMLGLDVEDAFANSVHARCIDSAAARGLAALNLAALEWKGKPLDAKRMAKVAAPYVEMREPPEPPEPELTPRQKRRADLLRRARGE